MPRTASRPHDPTPRAPDEPLACDLFCTVVDNFGDIGVCWRLARQLAHEHGWQVRLFVDDLRTFARLLPGVDPDAVRQAADGVVIEHWHAQVGDAIEIADIVIEAFACELPGAYLAAMARRARRPVWINLEYLSAEDWVADFHLRPSPHPRYPLVKTFFFPGLSAGTGGVLKERDLDARRAAFDADAQARAAWWQRATGDAPPAPGTTVVSLFAYDNPAVDALLQQWRDGASPVVALVPEGRVSPRVARFFGVESFGAGARASCGSVTACGLAFVPQADYDPLLWVSDLNFVRGEDSFVRAQWARRPFVWHIYPQADDAHLPKLDAALAHLSEDLDDAPGRALARFWHAWNGAGAPDWADFWQHRAALQANAIRWADALAAVGDLAGKLAEYAKSQLK
ncbi:elongation factor P maturation arginine rhamnosyltransferase EarP [Burkholderia stagnalis]|uniref:Protein-arginine rhamnosyltransferase n=1 Tax=Burkholderia stagnalis TaxID=1503054 RepID=A0ABX9YS97_9BURK|nr:elongation factor P maturation arginine rhamnosyltransferase EarP [Burkholderia stagnalis]RQQ62354.1 elongation factor P maturation arginine rhamnosyltransferase EarP [Burkholderia stagnalis]RQQ72197.1 elongation factor P maturation arginine rhamnosyltransferase EarP [Burkholderia stagnalis]RQQ73480.1 elongation factor P maturation arginine rhamnosyltransferase EarP [Burkholderia stagnalis]RQQ85484.1 elongation factor P maturation arginine rhamnosyltransferase EarP [Burkholderia stagnalis]R